MAVPHNVTAVNRSGRVRKRMPNIDTRGVACRGYRLRSFSTIDTVPACGSNLPLLLFHRATATRIAVPDADVARRWTLKLFIRILRALAYACGRRALPVWRRV